MKILIVDDSATVRLTTRRLINEIGSHVVVEAAGGNEGVAMFESESPELVILDVEMPDMGGIEVVRRLREIEQAHGRSWTPVMFVTSLNSESSVERCLEAGGDDFITKPLSGVILGAKLKAFKRTTDLMRRLEDSLEQAHNASLIDALTGAGNRRGFDRQLDAEWSRCNRGNVPLSCIVIDVDFFKRYNDTYGHQAGDKILRSATAIISSAVGRASDSIFRIGGEEFAILLPDTGIEGARIVAKKIHEAMTAARIPHTGGVDGHVSLSMGVAGAGFGLEEPSDMIRRADSLMYSAKKFGRNNYEVESL